MKLIIAGGRNVTDIDAESIQAFITYHEIEGITEVVCGCAKGVDTAGKEWGECVDILVKFFPADWNKYGKAAGPIRNKEMADYADALLVIWDGKSRGSKNMKETMEKLDKHVYEVQY